MPALTIISDALPKAHYQISLPPSRTGLVVQEANCLPELEQLRAEWFTLWQRCPDSTPFQSPGWLIAWWKHLGEGKLRVLALRDGTRLCGLAPCYVLQRDRGDQRELRFLGTGISDYLDILLDPAWQTEGLKTLSGYLEMHRSEWDLIDFQQLRSGASALNLALPDLWISRTIKQEVCPVLQLPPDIKELSKVLPDSTFSKLAYYRRRVARLPDTKFELAVPKTFPEIFQSFLCLHSARWAQRGQTGLLSEPRLQNFHWEAASEFMGAGVLRLYALCSQNQLIGVLYAFSHRKRLLFYLSGFNPALASFSPGMLMIGHAIEQAMWEGCEVFDFLRGNEHYKYSWGAKDEINYRRLVQKRI